MKLHDLHHVVHAYVDIDWTLKICFYKCSNMEELLNLQNSKEMIKWFWWCQPFFCASSPLAKHHGLVTYSIEFQFITSLQRGRKGHLMRSRWVPMARLSQRWRGGLLRKVTVTGSFVWSDFIVPGDYDLLVWIDECWVGTLETIPSPSWDTV